MMVYRERSPERLEQILSGALIREDRPPWYRFRARREWDVETVRLSELFRAKCGCWVCELGWGP